MKIRDIVALVTGANRGLGLAYVQALSEAGARRIYAAARDPSSVPALPGVVPLKLDVTNAADIANAAAVAADVSLLINNAGISRSTAFLSDNAAQAFREELETNFFGPLALSQAFAPVLKANGGGAIVNMLSALSWVSLPGAATYGATKAAAWALSNGLRGELRAQGTRVVAVHAAFLDTDMARHVTTPKTSPAEVARATLAALESGRDEVLADEISRQIKASLSSDQAAYLVAR